MSAIPLRVTENGKEPGNMLRKLQKQLKPVVHPLKFLFTSIDPETAQWILDNLNHPNNRRAKGFKIEQMVEDIRNNNWKHSHQGIAFSDEGWLIDGQNRLHAIAKAGKAVSMLVVFDVPAESMSIFDIGTVRSISDGARMLGESEITQWVVAVGRKMLDPLSIGNRPRSNQAVHEFCRKHREALAFVCEVFGPTRVKGITSSPVAAAVGRAFYTADKERLREFVTVLRSGMIENQLDDSAVIRLRDFLVSSPKAVRGLLPTQIYRKVQRALRAFLDRQPLQKLLESSEDLFPIPDDSNVVDMN